MHLIITRWIIALLSFGVSVASASQTLLVNSDVPQIKVGTYLEYLEDIEGQLSISDLLRSDEGLRWQPNYKDVPNFGFSDSTYWFRVKLQNIQHTSYTGVLEVGYPLLDSLQVYWFSDDGVLFQTQHLGDDFPFGQRPRIHRNFVIPVQFSAGEKKTLYIRLETGSAAQLPLTLWQQRAFHEHDADWVLGQGIFYGAMLIMVLYNLFVFFAVRDVSYLYYVSYVAAFSALMASMQGLTFQYVWPENLWLQDKSVVFFMALTELAVCLFADRFLSLKDNAPTLHRVANVLVAFIIVGLVFSIIFPYAIAVRILIGLVFLLCIFCLGTGLVNWSYGHKEAKYYTIAWITLVFALLVLALNKVGLVPRNFWTENMGQVGAVIEVALLSLALADRINRERTSKLQAQEKAIELERNARDAQAAALNARQIAQSQLTRKVKEKTSELESALEDLSIANQKLREISTVDGLTGLRNRRYFDQRLEKELSLCREAMQPLSLILLDIDHFKKLNDRFGHLCGDECLRLVASVVSNTVKWPADAVVRYGGEEFGIVLPQTDLEGATTLAERIRANVEASNCNMDGQTLFATVSLGIACFNSVNPEDDSGTLIAKADAALYEAKLGGRNQVRVA